MNGFADDYSDVNQIKRDYWEGGSRSTLGITVGTPIGVSFGLSFSQDTYRGFGVGTSLSFSHWAMADKFGPVKGSDVAKRTFDIGIAIGTDPYGGAYAGISAGPHFTGLGGLTYSANIGISTNFTSISFGGGVDVSAGRLSVLGASIGSNSSKINLAIGGYTSSVYNANAGKIQTESSGFGFTMPLPYGFSLGLSYNYTRYWSDETADILTNGSLYIPQELTDQSYFATRTYDIYRLPDQRIQT